MDKTTPEKAMKELTIMLMYLSRSNENIRQRLVIENDDGQYAISDVLSIGESEGIPVVFDKPSSSSESRQHPFRY